jgi:hypothetical protein
MKIVSFDTDNVNFKNNFESLDIKKRKKKKSDIFKSEKKGKNL